MSASRDQSQKVAFVYSNLYQIYQKGKSAAQNADPNAAAEMSAEAAPAAPLAVPKKASGSVLKADDLHSANQAGKPAPKVSSYNPTEFIGKRIAISKDRAQAQAVRATATPKHAIVSLKDNLKALNDLHSRLRFMLQELEDLVKE